MMYSKILNHGSSNSIVARLAIQTPNILDYFEIDQLLKDKIKDIMCKKIMEKLLACYDISHEINDYIENTFAHLSSSELPFIIELGNKCGIFLDRAKLALSDLSQLFSLFYDNIDKPFKNANYDVIYKWYISHISKSDEFSEYIKINTDIWIKELVDMRNALEHPENNDSVLNIKNYNIDIENKIIKYPVWNLNDNIERYIHIDMLTYTKQILIFSEDILCFLLKGINTIYPIQLLEIPEEQRDMNCPKRFNVIPTAFSNGLFV